MNRRAFLKAAIAAPVVAAVPAVGATFAEQWGTSVLALYNTAAQNRIMNSLVREMVEYGYLKVATTGMEMPRNAGDTITFRRHKPYTTRSTEPSHPA